MSNFEADVEVRDCGGDASAERVLDVLAPRPVLLGPRQEVQRVLPHRDRRMIGAWCFVDHYGPQDISTSVGMRVPPHPHTGLQTVSWLLAGEVEHHDSLGSAAVVVPGELNLMTAGPGIAHSEESPTSHSGTLHGLQLWVALPGKAREDTPPDFTQYRNLPKIERPGLRAVCVMGEFEGKVSPAATFTPIVGVDLVLDGDVAIELRPDFEYGVLCVDAGLTVEDHRLQSSEIAYVGDGRTTLRLSGRDGQRAFLLGGQPFTEQLVMWWNFIGRSHEEIVEFRRLWNAEVTQADPSLAVPMQPAATTSPPSRRDANNGPDSPAGRATDDVSSHPARFGQVRGFDGSPLLAPPMPSTRLKSRGRVR